MTFRTKALLFALAAVLFGAGYEFYRQSPHALVGHWHVHMVDEDGELRQDYMTMDIDDELIANLENIRIDSLNLFSQKIDFGGSCFYYHWKSYLKGDSLKLYRTYVSNTDLEAIGFRCGRKCCTPEIDFFRYDPVLASLPIIGKEHVAVDTISGIYMGDRIPVHVGKPVERYPDLGNSFGAFMRMRKLTVENFKLSKETFLIKYPESERPEVRILIFPDINTPELLLDSIITTITQLDGRAPLMAARAAGEEFRVVVYELDPVAEVVE